MILIKKHLCSTPSQHIAHGKIWAVKPGKRPQKYWENDKTNCFCVFFNVFSIFFIAKGHFLIFFPIYTIALGTFVKVSNKISGKISSFFH